MTAGASHHKIPAQPEQQKELGKSNYPTTTFPDFSLSISLLDELGAR
jgi:hypothetical protein